MFYLNQREIHSSKTKQYINVYIALGWLCIFMLLHKEIERLEFSKYSQLPHFQLALVIDNPLLLYHHRHYQHHLLHFIFITGIVNVIWQFQDEMDSRCSKSRVRDICCIIRNHAQDHRCFDEYD